MAKRVTFCDPEFSNFQSPKGTANTSHTFVHTSLSNPLASLVVLSVDSWTTYTRINARLITQQHILLTLYHQGTHNCDIQAFDILCLGPRRNCLSSSNTSPPFSSTTSSLPIFNWSWSSHTFHFYWKFASIIPIHKAGKPADSPASFRPLSLTSCLSKLFECLVHNHLCFYLESKNLITSTQASFRLGRSTIDQVFLFQSIWDGFQKKTIVLATIDLSKAFDSVWHSSLLHKLLA